MTALHVVLGMLVAECHEQLKDTRIIVQTGSGIQDLSILMA